MEKDSTFELRKFVAPEFLFGMDARLLVGRYAKNLGARKVLLATDPGVDRAGWSGEAAAALEDEGIAVERFSEISPNPRDYEVQEGAEKYRSLGCDAIIAVGGGSVMDCAKGIGIVVSNGGSVLQYEGVDRVPVPMPPLICIPTTSGTSADISQFCIIVNSAERYKMAIISKTVVPDVALVDPETTCSMDPYLTACTGMDALTHAIEAFASTASSPIVDVHALAAIRLVCANLESAVAAPGDLAARENMMLASLQAGLAFSNASLGAVHALAHSAGGFLDLPHGECNALLLEHVVRFNLSASPERYRQIADAMGIDTRGMEARTVGVRMTEALAGLRRRVGIDGGLGARGVRPDDLAELSRHAVRDACVVTNPRRVEQADARVIYDEAL